MTNSISDLLVACILAILLIIGGYQVYFLPQRWPRKPGNALLLPVDDRIPFWPRWIWVYSLLYYPLILAPIFTVDSFRHFAYIAVNFVLLLIFQVSIAYLFPVRTPVQWRRYEGDGIASVRFLRFVQSIDHGGNCFPSMHIAAATLAVLHVLNNMPGSSLAALCAALAVLSLISLSALFTKQHYILDIPAGIALAIAVYSIHDVVYVSPDL